MTRTLKLALAVSLGCLAGCTGWKFYEIESNYTVQSPAAQPGAEITASKEYRRIISSVGTVAVSAPAVCINETHSQSSGINRKQDTLLQADCGQEMSYIEKSLIDQGYRVISWKVVDNVAEKGQISVIHAAENMGAELLLVINSLERTMEIGTVTEWKRHYYASDKYGVRGQSVERSVSHRIDEAVQTVESYERQYWTKGDYPSVNLSATAISTSSGEAVWFYSWALPQPRVNEVDGSYVTKWACDRTGDCKPWGTTAERKQMKRHPESYSIHMEQPAELDDREAHFDLVKKVVGDMTSTLKHGR